MALFVLSRNSFVKLVPRKLRSLPASNMTSTLSIVAIVALIASTGAYVAEYSRYAEEGYAFLKGNYEGTSASVINSKNGLKLMINPLPEIVTGDTILFEVTSIPNVRNLHPKCGKFEGISLSGNLPYCRISHFGIRVTGPCSERLRRPASKKFPGFTSKSSFGSSASTVLLSGEKSDPDAIDTTYLEIILLFTYPHSQGPVGLFLDLPVFEIPSKFAGQSQDKLHDWAKNEAKVGVSFSMKPEDFQQLIDVWSVTIPDLEWLREVLAFNIRDTDVIGIHHPQMEMFATRPLAVTGDVIEGMMKLARWYLGRNTKKSEVPTITFSKPFLGVMYRRLAKVQAVSLF